MRGWVGLVEGIYRKLRDRPDDYSADELIYLITSTCHHDPVHPLKCHHPFSRNNAKNKNKIKKGDKPLRVFKSTHTQTIAENIIFLKNSED